MLWLLSISWAHIPVIFTAGPDEDWCAVIEGAEGGDYVMLLPGDYQGPCDIVGKLSEPEGEVTIVQSFDTTQPARFVHDGSSDHVLSITGEVLTILQVTFGPVPTGAAAVEVRDGVDLTVRYSLFEGGEGRGVVQVGEVDLLRVTDNRFEGAAGAPFDLGCGGGCTSGELRVDGNMVLDSTGAIEVELSAQDEVSDNAWFRHEGLALRAGGAAGLVTRNYIDGDAELDVADVRNNIVTGSLGGAAGSLRFNTLLGDVSFDADAVQANATLGADLGPGGVSCDPSCFTDLVGLDFFPSADSPLRGAGSFDPEVRLDWCGNERRDPPSAGAVEAVGVEGFGPIREDYKALQNCSVSEPTGTVPTVPGATGYTADTGSAAVGGTEESKGAGCGCATSAPADYLSWFVALGCVLAGRRSRSAGGGATSSVG